jgi:hypothetical protein
MKKLVVFFLFTLILVYFNNSNVNAQSNQKQFNGTISYSLKYEGDMEPALLAQQPKELEIKIFGNKSKTQVDQGGASVIVIKDADKKMIITLLDIQMLGKKIMMKTPQEDIDKELAKLPPTSIKYIDETKEIAGYKCRKGEITTKDDDGKEEKSFFFYTEELGVCDRNFDTPFKDVKGTLMEYEQKSDKLIVKMLVTKVKKQKVSEKDFMIPEGYEEMTQEQMKAMFGN